MKTVTDKPSYTIDKELSIGQANWDAPNHLALGQLAMDQLFKTVALESETDPLPLVRGQSTLDIDHMSFPDPLMHGRTISGEQLLNRRIFNDGLLVMHRGEVIHESYRNGLTADDRHVIHSCTKSLCSMIVAMAIDENLLDPSRPISDYIAEFRSLDAWQGVTLQHVLDMQAGIEYSEDYTNPEAHYWSYARAAGYYPPREGEVAIGARAWAIKNLVNRSHAPGTTFVYNSCLTNVLGMALEHVYQKDLANIFEEKLYRRIGPEKSAYFNTDITGFAITEGQLSMCLRDFARCSAVIAHQGRNLAGEPIIPKDYVTKTITPDREAQIAYHASTADPIFNSGQYKNQFWVLDPEQRQFTMLGIHGQFAWHDLNRQLMIVGLGSYPVQDGQLMMRSLNTLWQGVANSVGL